MFYKLFRVTGEANKTKYDTGLISTVAEPKSIKAILINVSSYNNNTIEGWIETSKIFEVPDDVCNTNSVTGADTFPFSTSKLIRIPIDENIPAGMIFKIAVNCGAAITSIDGSYEYEKVS